MEKRPILSERFAKLRAQRWSREAFLAAALTIAAVVFIAAAWLGSDSSDNAKSSVEAKHAPTN
jgi:hypothetical protein